MWSHSYLLGRRVVYDDAHHKDAGRQQLLDSLVRHPRVIAGALMEHVVEGSAGACWHLSGDRAARRWLVELEEQEERLASPGGWWTLIRLEHKLEKTSWEVWVARIQARAGVFERLWLVTPRGTRHEVLRRLLDRGVCPTTLPNTPPHT